MNLKNLLSTGILLFSTALSAAERPNILFLSVDDLKPLIGAYGRDEVPTPNMDRLAESGTVMLRNHCQQAICAASRMSMFTGLRPDSTKVWDLRTQIQDSNPEAVTMQQHFKQAGYATTGAGKVMHGARAEHPDSWSIPFTHKKNLPFNADYPIPAHDNGYYQNKKSQRVFKKMEAAGITHWKERGAYMQEHEAMPSTECLDIPDDAYVDGALAVWANQYLDQFAQSGEPFFLTVGLCKPHLPFVAPKKYWDLFERDEIELAEFQDHAKDSPDFAYHQFGELRSYTDIPRTWNEPIEEAKQRELIHGYYACVAYIDAQIGKILDKLEETGLDKNTIVVLWGDHGYHLGDHGMWNKHSNFEQATFAPLIITAPGYEGHQKTSSMTEMVDIFPTLIELAGLEQPAYKLEGKSLVPVLKNPLASVKDYSISQYPRAGARMGYALRNDRYRLVMWMKNDWRTTLPYNESLLEAVELYDYETDPLETVNYANAPQYAAIVSKLKAQMLGYFAEYTEEVEIFTGSTIQPQASGAFIDLNTVSFDSAALRFAKVQKENGELMVAFEHSPKWPSIDFLTTDDKAWDLSQYGQIDIKLTNNSAFAVKTAAFISNKGDSNASKKRNGVQAEIAAGATTILSIVFNPAEYPLDLRQLDRLRIFANKLQGPANFTIHSITASGAALEMNARMEGPVLPRKVHRRKPAILQIYST
ncbi:sulfatase [Coraliomargarita algicola]|uniref:Sulfatase n=1 Tax=Coraliomargarita algicola TaxID=3092156 RepID=A0ABZ0RI63_9BACT|nr:sulfatase [Coraliomargarita sp. J2-16]WPJ95163.1 sulfatase [Coraliomargarita sp. J2-16]